MRNFSRPVLDVSDGVLLAVVLGKRHKNYVGLRYEKIAVRNYIKESILFSLPNKWRHCS